MRVCVCVSAQLLYVTPVKIEFTLFTGMPKLLNTVNMAVAQNECHPSSALLLFALQLKSLLSLREWVRAFFLQLQYTMQVVPYPLRCGIRDEDGALTSL